METNIQTIKNRHDIVEVLQNITGANLTTTGDKYKTLCPFHQEKTPSFTIFPDQRFFCFGCGVRGDVIDFTRMALDTDFKGAIQYLENENPTYTTNSKKQIKRQSRRDPVVDYFLCWRRVLVTWQKYFLWQLQKLEKIPVIERDAKFYDRVNLTGTYFDDAISQQAEV
ncbi:hypothetical protein GF340_04175, partial [Candidatus Peregrinibacteria bacterium]|nr:hypothetical protein [Candidatus Peregrinibacteria bacterium]